MFTGIMKRILLALLVLTCLTIPAQAENISDIRTRQIEDGIYSLLYFRQQLQAIDNDMILFFGWMPEAKYSMQETAKLSIEKLDRLKAGLLATGMPPELTDVKNELMGIIEQQKDMYRGVESKTDEQIRAPYANFQKIIDVLTDHISQKMEDYLTVKRPSDGFYLTDEELKLFTNLKDQEAFNEATKLLDNKKFKESYDILSGLKDKYKNTSAEGSILLRMSDCILNFASDLPKELATDENGLKLLNEILDKKVYYPVLDEAFHRWRTKYQEQNHGMSNFSEIPNLEYNDKRMEIVKVIQKYLLNHPTDNWAKIQIISLLVLENIVRGDPMGNSNLRHMGVLYMNLEDLANNEAVETVKIEEVSQ